MQTCRKILQIFQFHFRQHQIVLISILQEKIQVMVIGIQRIFGEITPQLEVSHIVLYNFIPHFLSVSLIYCIFASSLHKTGEYKRSQPQRYEKNMDYD